MLNRTHNVFFILLAATLLSVIAKAQYASSNTVLTQKNCSGHISDLNCYQGIINKKAHELNVRDGFITPQDNDIDTDSINKAIYQGRQLIIDTFDRESCYSVQKTLETVQFSKARQSADLSQLCNTDLGNQADRYHSITLMWETEEEFLTPIKTDFFKSTEKSLLTDTRNLTYLMVATMGLLWVSPESVSNWNKEEIREKGFFSKWKQNVSNPPVMDKDAAMINFVGHPISGAAYYTIARSNGRNGFRNCRRGRLLAFDKRKLCQS